MVKRRSLGISMHHMFLSLKRQLVRKACFGMSLWLPGLWFLEIISPSLVKISPTVKGIFVRTGGQADPYAFFPLHVKKCKKGSFQRKFMPPFFATKNIFCKTKFFFVRRFHFNYIHAGMFEIHWLLMASSFRCLAYGWNIVNFWHSSVLWLKLGEFSIELCEHYQSLNMIVSGRCISSLSPVMKFQKRQFVFIGGKWLLSDLEES